MQSKNLEFVLAQAQDERQSSAIGKAVRDSIEVGVVVPSILRANLAKAGYELADDKAAMADYGFASLAVLKRVLVKDKHGEVVAMGAAGDPDEALLHAVLGYFRENALEDSEVPEGIAVAPG
jgi:hypothetical protein